MGTLYDNIMVLCQSRGIKGGKMCSDIGISKGLLTDLKMGRRTGVSAVTAQKIASYFNVSVGYLLGEEEEKTPTDTGRREVSDEDIQFALFGGNDEIRWMGCRQSSSNSIPTQNIRFGTGSSVGSAIAR